MWQFLEQAAKNASVNASGYVNTVQEKAQSFASAVQDEASTLLHSAIGSAPPGPVDELLYEELADYKVFASFFSVDEHAHEIKHTVDEQVAIRELYETLVPLTLNHDEFWCRYFFRQAPIHDLESKCTWTSSEENCKEEAKHVLHEDESDGLGLLRAERDTARRAASQWRQKARDFHQQLEEMKQSFDQQVLKTQRDWEQQLQTLCASYETKLTALVMQLDEARARGYHEGVQESLVMVESIQQKAQDDLIRLNTDIVANVADHERLATLQYENKDLEATIQGLHEQIATIKVNEKTLRNNAVAALTNEKDLWRIRAFKMKKLNDLVQAELTSLRQECDAEATGGIQELSTCIDPLKGTLKNHKKLQTRLQTLQTQLTEALAHAEIRSCEAYEAGFEAGTIDLDQRMKVEREKAFHEGYQNAQTKVESENTLRKAELEMFRPFHESAVESAEHLGADTNGYVRNDLLEDGQVLCSPTSCVSVFTDNGVNDLHVKPTDDWGEW
ncbi:hypothetical protein CCR75_000904 [Bremia lactucae]|uniref:BSD domain-containing protein n=1 Tax=Bremia lactucae TaxID=4779 RepID=A0A976FLI9_BRELC|nr:hypothetical protein CCR75_000904 [Bremia lactucae]